MGLLLIVYGTVSLWLNKTITASDKTRQSLCALLLCSQPSSDSPTALTPTSNETLAQARLDLVSNPASAYRWSDLAECEINANRVNPAKFCIRQALAYAPGNPAILFRAANFYIRLQDYPNSLALLLSVLRNPDLSDFYDRVFTLYSQMDLPLSTLLNQGIPRTPRAANAFLRFWINQDKLEEAQETWSWINQNSLTGMESAGSYVALLAKDNRWDEALDSWSKYTKNIDKSYNDTNWIYNGSFESRFVECPFDWHLYPSEAVDVIRDTEQGYKGTASLRITYSKPPAKQQAQANQTVILKPGKWEIRATMKTQGLTGDQGVVIRVVDAEDPSRLDVATNTFQQTQEWTPIFAIFEVPPSTHRARVEVMRPLGKNQNVYAAGLVWIDAVELVPLP